MWIKVEDRLPDGHPDDAEDVLVVFAKFGNRYPQRMIAWYDSSDKKWKTEDNNDIERNSDYFIVTHWQPLPQPPQN